MGPGGLGILIKKSALLLFESTGWVSKESGGSDFFIISNN